MTDLHPNALFIPDDIDPGVYACPGDHPAPNDLADPPVGADATARSAPATHPTAATHTTAVVRVRDAVAGHRVADSAGRSGITGVRTLTRLTPRRALASAHRVGRSGR
jgi:hypothetical protein